MTSALPSPLTSATCTSCQPAPGLHSATDTLVKPTLVPLGVVRPVYQAPPLVWPMMSIRPSPLTSATWTLCQPAAEFHCATGTLVKWTLVPLPVARPAHQTPALVRP